MIIPHRLPVHLYVARFLLFTVLGWNGGAFASEVYLGHYLRATIPLAIVVGAAILIVYWSFLDRWVRAQIAIVEEGARIAGDTAASLKSSVNFDELTVTVERRDTPKRRAR